MSNHLALATVTAVLRKTLQDALDIASPAVQSARTTSVRPNAPHADLPNPGVNIYLYQTTPNSSLRNADLPGRRGDGTVLQRPQAALDLHYLFTFHGNDARLEPQILHGITTRALHETPVITRRMIETTLGDDMFDFLTESDLADAVEMVRFSPIGLSVEEMSKLWSVFFQTPYVLSVAYRASVVLIESTIDPRPALPVRTRRVQVVASMGPVIDRLMSQEPGGVADDRAWITPGRELVVTGRGLNPAITRVRLGEVEVEPDPRTMSDTRLQVAVPASLGAGVQRVQLIDRRAGTPSPTDATSNVVPFVLHPTIQAQQVGAAIRVTVTPAVGRAQHVALLLNESSVPAGRAPRAYGLHAPARDTTAAAIDVPIDGVAPGTYLVRVQVDGAESPLAHDAATGQYSGPLVTVV